MTPQPPTEAGFREPLVAAVAPTGARPDKADHPAVPLTIDEIAATAAACSDEGATLFHLHVRGHDGGHILDAELYREATAAIRREAGDDLIVQITTDAVGRYGPDEQMAVVRETHPEAVSLAIKELIPTPAEEAAAARFLAWLHAEDILPQYILYSPQGVTRFQDLCRRGVVPGDRHLLLFVLGRYSMGQQSAPADLLPFLAVYDRSSRWAVCAFGRLENACALTAAALGGHARVGFENNMQLSDGARAPDNAALVRQLQEGAALLGRRLADGQTARTILWGRAPDGSVEASGTTASADSVLTAGRTA